MASPSFNLPSHSQSPFMQKSKAFSSFLGETNHLKTSPRFHKVIPTAASDLKVMSKFDLFQIMGGRGLCNGEKGILQELNNPITPVPADTSTTTSSDEEALVTSSSSTIAENAFDKELSGLTGGFPGGEKGLQAFIEKNPPPPKKLSSSSDGELDIQVTSSAKSKPPELPLLMPGMIAVVKNEKNPFYMYCGIIQRITDGKAGVLFEGGNWDKLITFKLDELERREKGPPMVNPKSAVLESLVQKEP
ncbi:NAD(P)H-quinone oxidoreductase subunit S protein [Thalictrum thalictroides]|uniref:NAD(P)H-quinone oxidoreductase subunit S protein n=1 Tax=Thalictrum thalictroides TaxID=46969 RepID=A0A7J6WYB2_THATH|nr:NAD(P)H-quinone oxidoreductase subunit S protein [Thalictrum thalictroides]